MSNRLPALTAVASMMILATASPAFCGDYARAAVVQVRGGLSIPSCADRLHGVRWSSDYRVHYNWCLGASFEAAGSERDARTNFLRACRG